MNTDHVGRTVDGSPVQSGLAQRDRLSFRPTEPPRNRPRRNMTPSLASRLTIWSRHDLMFTGPSWSCSQGIFEGPCDVYIYIWHTTSSLGWIPSQLRSPSAPFSSRGERVPHRPLLSTKATSRSMLAWILWSRRSSTVCQAISQTIEPLLNAYQAQQMGRLSCCRCGHTMPCLPRFMFN